MPNLIAKEPVESYKVTPEHKAFLRNIQRINKMKAMLDQGLQVKASELRTLQTLSNDLINKRKELMLLAPQQSALEVEDEGMVEL